MMGWLTARVRGRAAGPDAADADAQAAAAPSSGQAPPAVPRLNLHAGGAPAAARAATERPGSAATERRTGPRAKPRSSALPAADPRVYGTTPSPYQSFLAQQARIVMEGRMNKLKGRGLGKTWVPQHFVLKADAFYYTPNKMYSHKEKKISLVKTKIGTAQHYTKKDNAFGVVDARKRAMHIMCAESESMMHEWIRALIAVRTALEGRARDVKPNAALALNPRFPDIPSLPPPRKDDDDERAAGDTPPAPQASATYLAHLTDDSDGDDDAHLTLAGDDDAHFTPAVALVPPRPSARPTATRNAAESLPAAPRPLTTQSSDTSDDHPAHASRAPTYTPAARPAAADPLGLASQDDSSARPARSSRKQDPSPSRSSVISPARAFTATPRCVAEGDGAIARGVLVPAPQAVSAFSREMVLSYALVSTSSTAASPLLCFLGLGRLGYGERRMTTVSLVVFVSRRRWTPWAFVMRT